MCEATLVEKFSKWNVYRRQGKKVVENIETTPKPMTPKEALKYFKVNIISAVID